MRDVHLSPRQRQILNMLLDRKSIKQSADALNISVSTCRYHVRHIYSRYGVAGMVELVLEFVERPAA